jgi:hypothetical protein
LLNEKYLNMKQLRWFICIVITMFSTSLFSQNDDTKIEITHEGAFLEVDKFVHDYGTIPRKSNGDCIFILFNTGNQPLVLTNVQTSCGCAAADWPHKPIPPGESRELKITYDTRRIGNFSKSIKIFSNSEKSLMELQIKGTVVDD